VFQIDTKAALKGLLAAGIAAAALISTATPASATAVFIDKAEMYNPATAYITGFSGSNYPTIEVYDGPVLFTANLGTTAGTPTYTFLGFCVDIYDDINVGINAPMTENLQYHTGALVDNGAHGAQYSPVDLVTFTQTQKDNISKLVNYGTRLWNTDALTDPTHNISQTLINQLAGVQGAIWQLENPRFTVTGAPPINGFGNQATVTANIATYSGSAFLSTLQTGTIDVVFDSNLPAHQAFAFATTVPEPDAWALMIIGFGGIGAAMRRRRGATIAATA
jgi:hypothetical protein